jgi:hypothetical protein
LFIFPQPVLSEIVSVFPIRIRIKSVDQDPNIVKPNGLAKKYLKNLDMDLGPDLPESLDPDPDEVNMEPKQ